MVHPIISLAVVIIMESWGLICGISLLTVWLRFNELMCHVIIHSMEQIKKQAGMQWVLKEFTRRRKMQSFHHWMCVCDWVWS